MNQEYRFRELEAMKIYRVGGELVFVSGDSHFGPGSEYVGDFREYHEGTLDLSKNERFEIDNHSDYQEWLGIYMNTA